MTWFCLESSICPIIHKEDLWIDNDTVAKQQRRRQGLISLLLLLLPSSYFIVRKWCFFRAMIHLDDFPGHINIDDDFFFVPLLLYVYLVLPPSNQTEFVVKSSSQSRRKKRSQEGVKYGEIESFLCLRRSSASFILCSRPSLKEEESAWFPIIIALNSSGLKKYSYRHVFKATAMHYLVNPVWKNIIALGIILISVNAPKWKSPKTV